MKDFCIFMATIRPREQIAPVIGSLYRTLTRPSDVHIVWGDEGKSRAQDAAIRKLGPDYKFWAAFDDDVRVFPGWQDSIAQAFEDIPDLGAAGIEWQDTQEARNYMIEVNEPVTIGKTTIRLQNYQNVTGACIITRTEVSMKLPLVPVMPGHNYEGHEDGWRCFHIGKMGLRIGYVRCPGPGAQILHHPDSKEYNDAKQLALAEGRSYYSTWFK